VAVVIQNKKNGGVSRKGTSEKVEKNVSTAQ
jgi:hypothetical protein